MESLEALNKYEQSVRRSDISPKCRTSGGKHWDQQRMISRKLFCHLAPLPAISITLTWATILTGSLESRISLYNHDLPLQVFHMILCFGIGVSQLLNLLTLFGTLYVCRNWTGKWLILLTDALQIVEGGGKAVLALVTRRLFTRALLRSIEAYPVLAIYSGKSLSGISLCRIFFTVQNLFLQQRLENRASTSLDCH